MHLPGISHAQNLHTVMCRRLPVVPPITVVPLEQRQPSGCAPAIESSDVPR
jgi:hypothetical protein